MKKKITIVSSACAAALAAGMSAHADVTVTNLVVRGPGPASRTVTCWAPDGLRDGEAAVYVFLEQSVDFASSLLKPLMASGTVPPGVAVCFAASWHYKPGDPGNRFLRPEEFDQIGPVYPTFIIETIIPAVEERIGLRTSADPNLHFITGASSGGLTAFNACWYRNDYFRRAYCNSPTFSAIRGGNTLMPLVRKCEARPIRTWISVGTDEPDYYFGDSYLVAEDAVSALRFAGYEVRYDRFPHEDHGTHYWSRAYQEKVLAWLFEDWQTKPVSVATDPIRVRDLVMRGSEWTACDFEMPAPARSALSTYGKWRYSVDPTNRFVMAERIDKDGEPGVLHRLAPLDLAWDVSVPGGRAIAALANGRLLVATELGVQGVVPFGLADLVIPLPGDAPCDNVAVIGNTLFASSGGRIFRRELQTGAPNPAVAPPPPAPGYQDAFWYGRDHEPLGGMAALLGSYVMAGRISGVVSVMSDPDYNETYDCAGWAQQYGGAARAR